GNSLRDEELARELKRLVRLQRAHGPARRGEGHGLAGSRAERYRASLGKPGAQVLQVGRGSCERRRERWLLLHLQRRRIDRAGEGTGRLERAERRGKRAAG